MFHNLKWIHDLNISYDASTFDTDPFEPQHDRAGTIFPFWVNGNDGDGCAEGRHHGGMREFARLKWPGMPKRARLTRCHLTILPVPDQHSVRAAVTVTTERPL